MSLLQNTLNPIVFAITKSHYYSSGFLHFEIH